MGSGVSQYTSQQILEENHRTLQRKIESRRGRAQAPYEALTPWQQTYENIPVAERKLHSPFRVSDSINSKVSLWKGDITTLDIDAIVNSAAKPYKGEVNLTILKKAGDYYKAECMMSGLGAPGTALVTGAYNLPAQYIVNTLAPQHKERQILENCYRNSLNAIRDKGLKSVAVPCIATRMKNRFGHEEAAKIALETVREWMEANHESVDRVVFCVYKKVDHDIYKRLMQRYFPVNPRDAGEDPSNINVEMPPAAAGPEARAEDSPDDDTDSQKGAVGGSSSVSVQPQKVKTLESWRDITVKAGRQPIRINRMDKMGTFKQLYEIYSEQKIDFTMTPGIQYHGEPGVDLGALTREYFQQTLETLISVPIHGSTPAFEGQMDHMVPCASKFHLQQNIFYIIGKALAHSVLHSGLGFLGMSPAIIFLLTHDIEQVEDVETSSIHISLEDIPDDNIRGLLGAEKAFELSVAKKRELNAVMIDCNLGYMNIDNKSIYFIKQEIMMYEVVSRRWPMIQAIRQGMDSIRKDDQSPGLYTFLCQNPTRANIRDVFLSHEDLHIDPQLLMSKIKLEGKDDQTWTFFKELIDDIYQGKLGKVSLNDLLLFWTAEPLLPTGEHLSVDTEYDKQLPHAHTCFKRLNLPGAHSDYGAFKQSFVIALQHPTGFGVD